MDPHRSTSCPIRMTWTVPSDRGIVRFEGEERPGPLPPRR
jgi:hypothetical protein